MELKQLEKKFNFKLTDEVKVIRNEQEALDLIGGTFRVGEINRTYRELVNGLGEPTFDTPSVDNKIQVRWVCKFKGNVYTIYDWKTYDREITEWKLNQFNVGSKNARGYEVSEFVDVVRKQIDKENNLIR